MMLEWQSDVCALLQVVLVAKALVGDCGGSSWEEAVSQKSGRNVATNIQGLADKMLTGHGFSADRQDNKRGEYDRRIWHLATFEQPYLMLCSIANRVGGTVKWLEKIEAKGQPESVEWTTARQGILPLAVYCLQLVNLYCLLHQRPTVPEQVEIIAGTVLSSDAPTSESDLATGGLAPFEVNGAVERLLHACKGLSHRSLSEIKQSITNPSPELSDVMAALVTLQGKLYTSWRDAMGYNSKYKVEFLNSLKSLPRLLVRCIGRLNDC